ncbi:unnamed protein product, partial [Rotaria magnacalcarata]
PAVWDSTLISKSKYLHLCRCEQLLPRLILKENFFHSARRLPYGSAYRAQLQSRTILITDNAIQRLTHVIDRLQ